MEKKIVTSGVLWLWFMAVSLSVSYADFDYLISDTYYNDTLTLNSQSLQVIGAGAYEIIANGQSYVEIQDTLPLYGGLGGIGRIKSYETSIINISGGQVDSTRPYGNSTLNISGGKLRSVTIHDNSEVTVSGGDITYFYLSANYSQTATIICDLNTLQIDIPNAEEGIISGNWLDGTPFEMRTVRPDKALPRIQFVPEPATLALLGLGGLLIRRRKG